MCIDRIYRDTSLIRNTSLLEPYSRNIPEVLWWSYGEGLFLMSEVPLYSTTARGSSAALETRKSSSPNHPKRVQGHITHKKTHPPRTLPRLQLSAGDT